MGFSHSSFLPQTDCDGRSNFACPVGTCYSNAADGWIGCCSTTSCVPRTRCIEYAPGPATSSCDANYGGCLSCTNPGQPSCLTIINVEANQYIFYCNAVGGTSTVAYPNSALPGSIYSPGQSPLAPTPKPTSSSRFLPSSGPTASFSPAAKDHTTNLSHSSVAGIAVGCSVGTAVFLALAWFLLDRHRRRKSARNSPRSMSSHGGVGGAVVPEKQPKENGRFGVFQSNRYYNTQQNGRTQDTTSTKPHMIHDAYNTSIGPSSAVRSGTASPNAGLGITTDQPSPPFSPASFTLDPRHTTNFSITNGAPSPLPTGSTADGRFAADLRDSRGSAAAPAIELESKHQMFEADTVAGATSGGALSPPTPRTLNNRGSQFTTAGASSLRPSIRDMISPCSESPNLIQSRHPSQRSPPSAYQAYRNGGDQSVERGTSLTSATGYTGYKYMSPEDMMQHGWKNEPEPEPELRR